MANASRNPPSAGLLALQEVCDLLTKLAPFACVAFLGWCFVLVTRTLAGQVTIADMQILVTSLDRLGGASIAWAITIGSASYGYLQRRDKLRKTSALQIQIRELRAKLEMCRTADDVPRNFNAQNEERP